MDLELDINFFCPGRAKRRWNYFVRREKGKGIGLRIILSKRIKRRSGVGLRKICPNNGEKKSKVKQVRREVRRPVRWAGRKIMTESVSHIASKITACCHFMQLIKNRVVPSMLAAGANRKIAPVRIFLWERFVQLQRFIYSVSFFLFFLRYHCHQH